MNQANLEKLKKEFGPRLVTLRTGASGIRGGMVCEVKAVAGDAPVMDFIGSDNTVDRYNEVIDQAGWDLNNFRRSPVIADCHNYGTVANILGKALNVQVTDGKLVNRVEFCTDNPLGNLAWKMAKGGFLKSQSVGFIPLEWTNGNAAGQPDRTYTKQELLEISMVVVPANPSATVGLALKSGAVERADLKDLAEFLKQFCSDEADFRAKAGTSGAGIHDVRLLQMARGLAAVLRK
jgi:HK97 family phage prohead protease